jgi:glycosyltransferase involved in cell wall biosynthesis
MFRILHLSSHYPPSIGGQERFCDEIAALTARLGNEVHVITQYVKGKDNYEVIHDVKIHRIKPFIKYSKACVIPSIKQKIKELNPDVIHIQGISPGMADFIGKKNARIIMTWHNDPTVSDNLLYKTLVFLYRKFVFPKVVRKLDRIILPSEYLKHHSKFIAMVPSEKISIIPNAVDLEKFSPGNKNKEEHKKEVNISSHFLILFVASMDKQHTYKGIEILLDAIAQVRDLDVSFVLIGDGSLKQKYVELANSLGISNKITFTGKIDDNTLIKYYRASDVFVLPSLSTEVMPIVIIEAMACGTPVIATSIHGPMEMIHEGYTGHVVNPRDSADLAYAIRQILSDDSKLKEMQKNARSNAMEKYSWNNVLRQYFEEYNLMYKK